MPEKNDEVQDSAEKPLKVPRVRKPRTKVEPITELPSDTLPLETVPAETLPVETEPIPVVRPKGEGIPELLLPSDAKPQPAQPYQPEGPTIEERLQALKDDFRDRPVITVERQRDPYWLFTSAIAAGLAVASLLFSPGFTIFLSFSGFFSGVIALSRREQPRKLAWASTIVSGIIFMFPGFLLALFALSVLMSGILKAWYSPS